MSSVHNQEVAPSRTPKPAQRGWFDWLRAHGRSHPGWTPHQVIAAFVDPVRPVPAAQLPRWLCADLLYGEPLLLQCPQQARRPRPEFEVITRSGRRLGVVTGVPAEMIEFAVSEGIVPQVTAIVADPDPPAKDSLQLCVEFVAWFAPGERIVPPMVYDERVGKS